MVDESRRGFLKKVAFGVTSLGGFSSLRIPVFNVTMGEFFQKHYKEMSEEEKRRVIERLERRYREEYGVDAKVKTTPPREGVVFGYALDIKKCIGCRRCVYACMEENNCYRSSPTDPTKGEKQWIRVIALEKKKISPGKGSRGLGAEFGDIKAGIHIEESVHYYDPEKVPEEDRFYMPVQCMQCEKPPCVEVCPVQATWKEPDGIIVVDYDWCIGCKYCLSACPYWARRFNYTHGYLPEDEVNPDMHYLGNRPRPHEVAEKCTFCIQRTREGRYPACVEVCPVGARKFGNLLDPESEVRKVLAKKRVFRLKEELGTDPKFFYFMW